VTDDEPTASPPQRPPPADQRWFWTAQWQEREREVDAHVAAGDVTVHADGEALLEHLDGLVDDEQ
jgi:hypothetical protein